MSLSWYNMVISLQTNNSIVFRGKFSVDNSTNAIHHFVDITNTKKSMLAFPPDSYQADYKYISGKFTFGGTVLNKIPSLATSYKSASFWNIWQSIEDTNVNLSYFDATDKKWYDIVDNSGNYGNKFSMSITSTTAKIAPTIVVRSINKSYFLRILDKNTSSNIFVAKIMVDTSRFVISSIKNTVGTTANKLINLLKYTEDDNSSDYKLINEKFTMAGTSISTIPALDSLYGATQWQLWNYSGVHCLSYKNASNEWKTITPTTSSNRYTVTVSLK
jgi:hypothetical protein